MATNFTERANEVGRRIARHAASACAERNDFRSAALIAAAWGCRSWRLFVTGAA